MGNCYHEIWRNWWIQEWEPRSDNWKQKPLEPKLAGRCKAKQVNLMTRWGVDCCETPGATTLGRAPQSHGFNSVNPTKFMMKTRERLSVAPTMGGALTSKHNPAPRQIDINPHTQGHLLHFLLPDISPVFFQQQQNCKAGPKGRKKVWRNKASIKVKFKYSTVVGVIRELKND